MKELGWILWVAVRRVKPHWVVLVGFWRYDGSLKVELARYLVIKLVQRVWVWFLNSHLTFGIQLGLTNQSGRPAKQPTHSFHHTVQQNISKLLSIQTRTMYLFLQNSFSKPKIVKSSAQETVGQGVSIKVGKTCRITNIYFVFLSFLYVSYVHTRNTDKKSGLSAGNTQNFSISTHHGAPSYFAGVWIDDIRFFVIQPLKIR